VGGFAGEKVYSAAGCAAGYPGVTGYAFALGLKTGRLVKSYVGKSVLGRVLKRDPVPVVPRRQGQVARRLQDGYQGGFLVFRSKQFLPPADITHKSPFTRK
jgi:hypothetical protein